MKTKLITLLLMAACLVGYAHNGDDQNEKSKLKISDSKAAATVTIASSFACCDSYISDAETGESFVAVTVCRGGSSTSDYIVACVHADAIRDQLLAIF